MEANLEILRFIYVSVIFIVYIITHCMRFIFQNSQPFLLACWGSVFDLAVEKCLVLNHQPSIPYRPLHAPRSSKQHNRIEVPQNYHKFHFLFRSFKAEYGATCRGKIFSDAVFQQIIPKAFYFGLSLLSPRHLAILHICVCNYLSCQTVRTYFRLSDCSLGCQVAV